MSGSDGAIERGYSRPRPEALTVWEVVAAIARMRPLGEGASRDG